MLRMVSEICLPQKRVFHATKLLLCKQNPNTRGSLTQNHQILSRISIKGVACMTKINPIEVTTTYDVVCGVYLVDAT